MKILERVRLNDKQFIAQLYEQHRLEYIHFSSKKYGLNQEDSADIYQESFIDFVVMVREGKLTTLSSSFKTFLFQIGIHRTLNQFRRQRVKSNYLESKVLEQQNGAESFFHHLELLEDKEWVQSLMDQLPQKDQKVLELFYFREFNMESIAREMGYKSANMAKKKKFTALRKLITLAQMQLTKEES